MAQRVEAVDLFCGAGGLSYGLQQGGITVRAGVDLDPKCRYPFEENIHADFHELSVRDLTGEQLRSMWSGQGPRLLAGCAPCQPFSSQRRGQEASTHEAWDLLLEFQRLVKETRPDFVTMENVTRLQNQAVFRSFVSALIDEGYYVDYRALYANEFGLPQRRRRLVLIASLHGPIHLPTPTHGKEDQVTVSQAIGQLPPLESGEASHTDLLHRARRLTDINIARIKASKPGGTWRDWPEVLRAPCHRRSTGQSFGSFYGVMEPNEPAPTITTEFYNYGSGRFGHPTQPRTITPREAAILQGFPKDYKFVPHEDEAKFSVLGRMIGNAVPPIFGELIAQTINSHKYVAQA